MLVARLGNPFHPEDKICLPLDVSRQREGEMKDDINLVIVPQNQRPKSFVPRTNFRGPISVF